MRKSDYLNRLTKEQNPYDAWIDLYEEKLPDKEIKGDVSGLIGSLGYIVFTAEGGQTSPLLYEYVSEAIHKYHPDIIYTDEDVCDEKRHSPYFKPDFSPDTLDGFFYLGGLLIVSNAAIKEFSKNVPAIKDIKTINKSSILLLKQLVMFVFENNYKKTASFSDGSIVHIPRVLYHADRINDYSYKTEDVSLGEAVDKKKTKVSAIILSKDNPDMLKANISSLLVNQGKEKADDNLEIIVVDNGSSDENKQRIEEFLEPLHVQYYHKKCVFEYSTLCNFGAEVSSGEYLLFLNDDVIFKNNGVDIIKNMLSYAVREHVGAVGIKLHFPGEGALLDDLSDSFSDDVYAIQHAGISLMATGPSHKLASYKDDRDYYFGRNLLPYNALAVTGACMMVKRDKFCQVGGFDTSLKIAYTDVDLCVDLYEKGYMSVCLNNISAFHFESVSRGNDVVVKEKANRLKNERNIFYKKHEELMSFADPFIGPNITKIRLDYSVDYMQEWEKNIFADAEDRVNTKDFKIKCISEAKETQIMGSIDRLTYIPSSSDSLPTYFEIEGWMIMHKKDQLKYEMYIGMLEEDRFRYYPVLRKYREDIVSIFANEKNIAMSGFVVRIKEEEFERYIENEICLVLKKEKDIFGKEIIKFKKTDKEICLGESV